MSKKLLGCVTDNDMFSDFKVQRVRSKTLPIGPVYYPCSEIWLRDVPPRAYARQYGACSGWGVSGNPPEESAIQSSDIVHTGDVPRKYKEKIALSFPGNRTIKLWDYLPFYKLNFRTRIEPLSAPGGHGYRPQCYPDGVEPLGVVATAAYGNEWRTRLPTEYPSPAINTYNPCDSYGLDGQPFDGTTEDFFRWCDEQNLSYLVKKALAGLESALTNFPDMLVILGELTEVASLLKRPKSVGDAYLQNQFGVQPTIGSIEDVVVGVAHRWNDAFGPKKLIVRIPIKGTSEQIDGAPHLQSECCRFGASEVCPKLGRSRETYKDEGVVTLELTYSYEPYEGFGPEFLRTLDKFAERVNAVGDLSTLWELTPFSWMVDWFIPVGTIVAGISAKAGIGKWNRLHVHMGYVSFRRVRSRTVICNKFECLYGSTSVTRETDEYVRVPLRNPWSWLDMSMNTSSAPHTISQLLTVAALAKK